MLSYSVDYYFFVRLKRRKEKKISKKQLIAERRRNYDEKQKILHILWYINKKLGEIKVSVAYIQMTVQYNHILLLVTPYRTT
jgi:hypothetical protein